MNTGVVKWFNPDKGYGFIQPDKGGPDVFVHNSQLKEAGIRMLSEGEKIGYDITTNKGRSCASNLKVIH